MRIIFWVFLVLFAACSQFTNQKEVEVEIISRKAGTAFKRIHVQELLAEYAVQQDLTPLVYRFLEEAKRSKARYLSHIALTTYQGSTACMIVLGTEADLRSLSHIKPSEAPRRLDTESLSKLSKEKLYESKPFCRQTGMQSAKTSVFVEARIYIPREGENKNNAID